MDRQNSRHRIRKLTPEEIAQIIRIDQQRLAVQTVVEVQPAPLDSVLHQRQAKAPFGTRRERVARAGAVYRPRPRDATIAKLQMLFRMSMQARFECALVRL